MKKLVVLLLLLSLLLVLGACGDDQTVPTEPAATQGQTQTNPHETLPTTVPTEPTTVPTQPPHEHTWVDATCTAPKTCATCGTVEGNPKDHSWDVGTVTVEATEEAEGEKRHACTACGATKTVVIPALGHTHAYEAKVTKPTCTEAGYTTHTCRCGDSYVSDEVAAKGHDWKAADCTSPKTCKTCGATEGSAKGHDWMAADCTSPKTCKTCGATEGSVKGHDWKAADCATPKTCKTCGATEGSAKGHDWKKADCTSPKTCKTCGATEGSAKGHDWKSANCTSPKTCKTCGATEGSAKGHDWKSADCASPKTCKTCGATEGSAKGHDWKKADCTAPKTCKTCGATEGTVTGHTWQEASCTKPKRCSGCGATEGAALGHNWTIYACESWMKCSRCGEYGGEYVHHSWNEYGMCTMCLYTNCEIYGHEYFYNRCFYCKCYDEECIAMAEALLPQIVTAQMSEYEMVKAIHDYIVNNTQYDYDRLLNGTVPDISHSPLGVLQYGVAVCQGYAYAFELLCDLSGIECDFVGGVAGGGGHAWNQVKVDGKWYNVDTTWDDPIYYFNGVLTPYLSYDSFLVSDAVLYQDHVTEDAQHVCTESYPMP